MAALTAALAKQNRSQEYDRMSLKIILNYASKMMKRIASYTHKAQIYLLLSN